MGLNCHIQGPVDKYKRRVELELLYEQILNLQKNKIVEITPNLQEQLRSEGSRHPSNSNSEILTPELRAAAKSLHENQDIVIRRADKSNIFVILNRTDYIKKIDYILKDGSKFQKITKNPCDAIKTKINKQIDRATEETGKPVPLRKIVGDYSPGYIYGNVKTHKEGKTIRPIISQITSPTYRTAKQLDSIIKVYLPQGKMLKSSAEFVDLIHGKNYKGKLFSLDVESLFTNVPVHRTINIILEKVYNHPTIRPPAIPKNIMRELLLTCTTEVPFRNINGDMYVQRDGVSMGSPLGPTFANFFMAEVENRALQNLNVTPALYGRYIDDIFTICEEEELILLKDEMMNISGLIFTIERSVENKLPFLNVLVERTGNTVRSSVFRKPTDIGRCLNALSECPDRYKVSVVKGFLFRARNICSDKPAFLTELNRSKQILVNNGYSNQMIDSEIKKFLRRDSTTHVQATATTSAITTTSTATSTAGSTHKIFYMNFMNPIYKKNEAAIRKIVKDNVRAVNSNDKLQLIIYYKSLKTRDLIMKNNLSPKLRDLARTNLIYDFTCSIDGCKHLPIRQVRYSGLTTCTLSRRLSFHLQKGAIQKHCESVHGRPITREEIVSMTKARYFLRDIVRLEILEALIIRLEDPEVNKQETGKVRFLKLHGTVMHCTENVP